MTDIRKRLASLKYIDSKVKSKRQEIVSLHSGILKSQQYSDEPKGGSLNNKSEDLNILIIDRTRELYDEIESLLAERRELVQMIESLDDPMENIVLRLLYVNGYSWSEVKMELNASHATIQRARDKAVRNLLKNDTDVNK
ncbi:DUF1492 domain-containing protein [Streptococcus sp. NLN76]|uniref:DUF1492 domain-containing protein n=1 Tax=Streptococcus sp. NLN76 TaxID=2822800 RepID=UPI0018AC0F58|nr:DUF1492 domain-containing protein [Streptococcus sp. NLN76]MBF8970172.1 DUF1492 domain-containing protein [Streptococcus sp. NLN76]